MAPFTKISWCIPQLPLFRSKCVFVGFWIMQDATCHLRRVVVKRNIDAVRFVTTHRRMSRVDLKVVVTRNRCFQSHWWTEFNGIFQAQLLLKTDRYTRSEREIISRGDALFLRELLLFESEITVTKIIIITLSFLYYTFLSFFINFILVIYPS